MKKQPATPPKFEHLHDLLGKFGLSVITHDQFWGQMKKYGYGQDDIDWYLAEDRRMDNERAKDGGEGSGTSGDARVEGAARRPREANRESQEADRQGDQGNQQGEGEAQRSRTIVLSERWLARAIEVGKARNAFAAEQDYQNYGQLHGSKLEHDITGAIGECAVAAYFRVKWKANVGVLDGVDVGKIIEVRTRRPSRGRDLNIRPDDKDERPYVLTWVHEDNSVELVGWLFAKEAKGRGQWRGDMGVWFVPPPYRSLSELERMLVE